MRTKNGSSWDSVRFVGRLDISGWRQIDYEMRPSRNRHRLAATDWNGSIQWCSAAKSERKSTTSSMSCWAVEAADSFKLERFCIIPHFSRMVRQKILNPVVFLENNLSARKRSCQLFNTNWILMAAGSEVRTLSRPVFFLLICQPQLPYIERFVSLWQKLVMDALGRMTFTLRLWAS